MSGQRRSAVRAVMLAIALAWTTSGALAAKPTWDRVGNIKHTAVRLAELQKTRGAEGAYKFISDCYKTHTLGSVYSQGLESCLVLDIIHSKVTAAVYARLDPARRQEMQLPEPDALTTSMSRRVVSALKQYDISAGDMERFVRLVDTHGMPEFTRARFPDGGATEKPAPTQPRR